MATDLQRARRLWESGDAERAVLAFERIVRGSTDDPSAWEGLGTAYWSLGRFCDALISFQKACSLEPTNPAHWSNIGLTLRHLKQYAQGINALRSAVIVCPGYAAAYNEWANILIDLNRPREAVKLYEKAISLDCRRAVYHHNLGVCTKRLGDRARASKYFETAQAMDPTYAPSIEELGLLHLEENDLRSGIELLRRASTRRAMRILKCYSKTERTDQLETFATNGLVNPPAVREIIPGLVASIDNVISPQVCAEICREIDQSKSNWPKTSRRDGSGYVVDLERRCVLRFDVHQRLIDLVLGELKAIAPRLAHHFGISVSDIERPQFLRYGEGHFFSYHQDVGAEAPANQRRQLSLSICLNRGSRDSPRSCSDTDYTGGKLRFFKTESDAQNGESMSEIVGGAGELIAFRPSALHEVTKINNGMRYCVVTWLLR